MKNRGFTLVEVLVALAIVAIALGAGLRASGSQINLTLRQSDMLLAQLCIENELIKMRLSRQLPDIGEKTFTCEQAGQTLQGKLDIKATPNPSFRKVDALVIKGGDTLLRFTTLASRF